MYEGGLLQTDGTDRIETHCIAMIFALDANDPVNMNKQKRKFVMANRTSDINGFHCTRIDHWTL